MAIEVTTDLIKDYFTSIANELVELNGNNLQEIGPSSPQELAQFLIDKAEIKEGDIILDAGSATGYVDILLTQQFSRVEITALDICPEFYETSQKLASRAGADPNRFKPMLGDFNKATNLFPPASFDKILFLESILYSPNLYTTLRQARVLLKPTGRILIKDNFSFNPENDKQEFSEFYSHFRQQSLRNIITLGEMINKLEETGFIVKSTSYEPSLNPIRLPQKAVLRCEDNFKKIVSKMVNIYIDEEKTDVIAFQPCVITAFNTFVNQTISSWSLNETEIVYQ